MWFDEWRELKRHSHPVTVWDVVRASVLEGTIRDLNAHVPTPEKIRESEKPMRAAFSALIQLLKDFPLKRRLVRELKKIHNTIETPAEIIRSGYYTEENPLKNPGITWYAYIVDLLAHEYGWTEKEIRSLPYSSINEFMLAIECRRVAESSRRVIESHPTERGIDELNKYPRRKMKIPQEILDDYFAKKRREAREIITGAVH